MFSAPFQVDFDITMNCMYRCKHCNVAAGELLHDEMTTEQIFNVLDQLDELGISDVSITGGEPLLRSDCLEILKYAASKIGFFLTLNTNGLLITQEVIEYLQKNCPHINVCVSLDGFDPVSYSILRQRKHNHQEILEKEFYKVKESLTLLSKSGLRCCVNYTVTKATLPNFIQTYNFIKSLGINNVLAIKFFPYGYGRENREKLELEYSEWKNFLIDLANKKNNFYYKGIAVSVPCPWEMYLPLLDDNRSIEDVHTIFDFYSPLEVDLYKKDRNIGCHAGITSCAISPNGDLYPCGTISAKFPALVCGNLKEDTLQNIWLNSPLLLQLRKLDISEIEGDCISCKISTLCGGGCRCRAFSEFNSLKAKDYLCPLVD